MTNPWDIAPMPPAAEPWGRLLAQGELVGYRKKAGRTYFYSSDGYAWTGKVIEHDAELTDTGLKDRNNRRVFEGDIVIMPGPSGKTSKVALLHHETMGIVTWDLNKGILRCLPDSQKNDRGFRVQEVLDNIHADDELQRRATALLSAFSPHDTSTWSAVFALSATMLGVTAAGILLQLLVWQLVRPLVTFGTMFVGAWTFFYFKHRASPGWLTRPRLFSIARRTMGCLTPLGFIGYGAILFGGMSGLDEARAHPLGALAGVALAVALLTFTSVVLAGDIVAWSHDGYTDEKSAS